MKHKTEKRENSDGSLGVLQKIGFPQKSRKANPLLGLFSDDVDMLEQITEEALESREKHPLRARP
jgi:hypothetical protein